MFKYFLLTLALMANVGAIGIGLGPFELEIGEPRSNYYAQAQNPFCYAIRNRKLIEMTMEWREKGDQNDTKVIVKRITFEPYLFGLDKQGQPILRGNVINERVLKEISIKFYPENEREAEDEEKEGRWFSGLFKARKREGSLETLNVSKVDQVNVIEGSSFEAPKNLKDLFHDDVAEVICIISTSSN